MPRFHDDDGDDIQDVLHEVYLPFERVLAAELGLSVAKVRQRRHGPPPKGDALYEHWSAQVGVYDKAAEKFIPKAIHILQHCRLLPRSPDGGKLASRFASTRLGDVLFPGYYCFPDFHEALDAELGVLWWMVAAQFGDQPRLDDFREIKRHQYFDLVLSEQNVLQFLEANWMLRDEEMFRQEIRRSDVCHLLRHGQLVRNGKLRSVYEMLSKRPFAEMLQGTVSELMPTQLAGLSLDERLALKKEKKLPLTAEEKAAADRSPISERLQKRAQREYDESSDRTERMVLRARMGLWGWLRLWLLEKGLRPHSPEWYIWLAESVDRVPDYLDAKVHAAQEMRTTTSPSEFYAAWEALAEPTRIETKHALDPDEPEPCPQTLGEYIEAITDDVPGFIAELRERFVAGDEGAIIADDEAEKAYNKGDILAGAGIPGRLLNGDG